MGKTTGFLEFERNSGHERDPLARLKDWQEFHEAPTQESLKQQGARCMDCGIPFCQTGQIVAGAASGCPVLNLIPEFNDLVYRDHWEEAYQRLSLTNNFPEFTGRVCPAPCEGACVLGITNPPVSIKNIELSIIDRAFQEGWVKPRIPSVRTGKKVAVIGSGPAGLACADQLNQEGHFVVVFEREDRAGGLLMYGIPNMKLDKAVVERRIKLLQKEGVKFQLNATIGSKDYPTDKIEKEFDAIVLCTGATVPRNIQVQGREAHGIYFAMDFLTASTKALLDKSKKVPSDLSAKGKDVVVIGGGDTGTDCVGTSLRQGCKSLVQFEVQAKPPLSRSPENPWPQWPRVYQLDYGQEEAKAVFGQDPRAYATLTKAFVLNSSKKIEAVETVQIDSQFKEIPGTEKKWPAQLVLLAVGFLGPEAKILQDLSIKQDSRSNIDALYGKYQTSVEKIFAAGDARRGQSLIVWAIHEGREAAKAVHNFLTRA